MKFRTVMVALTIMRLTRARGAGSLAHEWFHSVDNYFARMRGEKGGYVTDNPKSAREGVRPEMAQAFDRLMQAVNAGKLVARSRKLDQTRSKPYWGTSLEMAARSFESYIIAKLQDQGASNDYLANIVSEAYWDAAAALGMEKAETYPYPTSAEVPAIRAAFDHFFQTVETKETERGVTMFSRAEDLSFASEFITDLASVDEVFRYPASRASTIKGAFKDILPDAKYYAEHSRTDERDESGADHRFVFATNKGQRFYVYTTDSGKVWIDVSRLEKGEGGSAVYAAALAYAHNTRQKFVGDPNGVSDVAVIRRTNAMLSSALRYGTTQHMEAAPEQVKGVADKGIAPLEWAGSDVEKVRSMIDNVVSYLEAKQPEFANVRYDFDQRAFVDTNGVPYSEADFGKLVERGRDRTAEVGGASLKRGVLLASLVRSPGSERPRLLEQVLRQPRELVAEGGLAGTFSRSGAESSGVPLRDINAVVAAVRRAMPGAPPIHVHEKVSQAPRALVERIRAAGAENDVEAAFHEGEIHVFPKNIASVERAQFVVGHHEIRHYGLRSLLGPKLDGELLKIYANNAKVMARTKAFMAGHEGMSRAEAIEEVLADTTLEELAKLKGIDRLIAAIRSALRLIAMKLRQAGYPALAKTIEPEMWTDKDVLALVARAEEMSMRKDTPFRAGGTALASDNAFKAWFRESKVVDADGKPMVVYHGTGSDITSFDPETDPRTWESDRGLFFFTSSSKTSSDYSEIAADKHFRGDITGANVIPVYLSLQNPLIETLSGDPDVYWDEHGATFAATARANGNDGVIIHGESGQSLYVAFKPTQIKSAIGNRGTFEASNPDIRFSRAKWIDNEPTDTQEALRKAGVWFTPPTLKARVQEWSRDWQKRLKQGLVDQFEPIKEYDYNAYMLARLTRGADAALDGLLNYGTVYLDGDGAVDVNFEKGGFLGIMSKLKGEHDRFLAWVIGNRAERLLAEGREHNFTPQDIVRLKALSQGKLSDGSPRPQEYARVRAELDRYNKSVLDIAERAGLIDGAGRATWEKDFYVPFYRLMEDADQAKGPMPSKGLVNQYAFKVLKGGEQALGDPMENVLKNWAHLLDASLKNQAARDSLLAAQRVGAVIEGPEETVRQMAKAAGMKDAVVSFTDQGVQRWFMVEDPFLLDALKSIGFTGFQGVGMKVMQKFKKWLTMGVTVSPTFRIRNVMRDSLQMIGANPASYNVLDNVLTGWKATKEGTPEFASILAGGGVMRFGTLLEGNRAEHVKRLIEAGVDDKTILTTPQRVKDALQQGWDWWQHVGDRAENVNRAALYKKLRADGKTHLEASFAARDTMDFSMQGTWASVRFLSQTVPFFNARLQGLYKLGRGAAEDPRRFGIVVGAATLASLALFLAYKDDDDWKRREDWDRETFWWFKIGNKAFRIPKPFEIGAISTIAERGLEYMSTDELTGKQFASRVYSIVSQQLSMNPIPQMAMPIIELYANRDSFTDRPIESMGMERRSKPMRSGPNTSATAQLLGKNGFISPVQIDHLVSGYLGWLGSHVVSTADLALRPAMGLPGKPAWRTDEVLVIGDFVKELPAYQSKYVTRMYDQMKDVQQAMGDLRELQKIGATEEAKKLMEAKADKLKLYRLYTHAEKQMESVTRQIKLAQIRTGDADLKRERLDGLYATRNRIAKFTEERATALRQ